MAVCMEYQRAFYRMLATDNLYVFEFESLPLLNAEDLLLGDGSVLRPGDRLVKFGGRNTSASYRTIHLIHGSLRYDGVFIEPDSPEGPKETVMFSYSLNAAPLLRYGANIIKRAPLLMCFSTPAVSSRLIETTTIERA